MVPYCGVGLFRASETDPPGIPLDMRAPALIGCQPGTARRQRARNIVPLNGCTRIARNASHRSRPSTGRVTRFAPRTVHPTHAAGDTTRFDTDVRRYLGRRLWHLAAARPRKDERQDLARLQVGTNGGFVDAKPGRGRPQRQAALEKSDGRVWVGLSLSRRAKPALQVARSCKRDAGVSCARWDHAVRQATAP